MDRKTYFVIIFVLAAVTDAVKVNMQASIRFGKDVMETVRYFMRRNMDGRRSMSSKESDHIRVLLVDICKGVQFCDKTLENFLTNYITVLTRAVEGIFQTVLNVKGLITTNELIIEDEFRKSLDDIKEILRATETEIEHSGKEYAWIGVLKKISNTYQQMATQFVKERLESNPIETELAKQQLVQKVVIAIIMVEGKYEKKLCSDHKICLRNHPCTTNLNTLLQMFENVDEDSARKFIQSFYTVLSETKFSTILSEVTWNEFQVVLNDMAYTDSVPTTKVLLTLQKTIQSRIESFKTTRYKVNGRDVELLYVILSDIDYIYQKGSPSEMHSFLEHFHRWLKSGHGLKKSIRNFIIDLTTRLKIEVPDVFNKITREVRIFLEITVDPEPI